jgi:hypothetical protein
MKQTADAKGFPALFSHANRADWGVSVLSGEHDGKRRYLFEGGEERTMGAGALDLMRKVEQPDSEQRAAYARLMALLAKREKRTEVSKAPGSSAAMKQLERFHKKYPGGFFSREWKTDEATMFARRARGAIVEKAQDRLSASAVAKLLKAERFEALWELVITTVNDAKFSTEKLQAAVGLEQQRSLAEAAAALLHGTDSYEHRLDRFIAAYESAFRNPPSWEATTAVSALTSPVEHVLVAPALFRKQLKALARTGTFGARPSGVAYTRCLTMAQALANLLAARGEVPRDMLDVHDFIRETVTATATAKAGAPAVLREEAEEA